MVILDVGPIICILMLQDLFSSLLSVNDILDMGTIVYVLSILQGVSLHHCGCIISCLDILLHYLTFGRFTKVRLVFTDHLLQHLANITSRVVHVFILSPALLVLLLRVKYGTQLVELTYCRGTKWVVVSVFLLKVGKYINRHQVSTLTIYDHHTRKVPIGDVLQRLLQNQFLRSCCGNGETKAVVINSFQQMCV